MVFWYYDTSIATETVMWDLAQRAIQPAETPEIRRHSATTGATICMRAGRHAACPQRHALPIVNALPSCHSVGHAKLLPCV